MKYTWLLDNGHGKETPGKRSPKKDGEVFMYEWEFNRAVVLLIAQKLTRLGIKFIPLVPENTDISLGERVRRANKLHEKHKNCILVSVHGNAAGSGADWHPAKGIEVFTTKGKTKSDKVAEAFADKCLSMLPNVPFRADNTDGDKDKEADFYIIKNTVCPAILTENGFMTNERECAWMNSAIGREIIADIHVEAILEIEKNGL